MLVEIGDNMKQVEKKDSTANPPLTTMMICEEYN